MKTGCLVQTQRDTHGGDSAGRSSFGNSRRPYRSTRHKADRYVVDVLPCLILILLQGCSQPNPNKTDSAALRGCWHYVKQTVTASDGTTSEQHIDCTAEYFASSSVTQCLLKNGGGSRHIYTYGILRDGAFRSTLVENSARPSDIGSVVEARYKIVGDQMRVTVHRRATEPNLPTSVLQIETVGIRQAAPELCTPIGIRVFSPYRAIATVNGKPITQGSLDELIRFDTKSDTLERRTQLTEKLIDDEVLTQEAIRQKIPERDTIPTDAAARPALIQALLRHEADRDKPTDAQVRAEYDRRRKEEGDGAGEFIEVKSQIAEELWKRQLKAFTESLKANASIVRY